MVNTTHKQKIILLNSLAYVGIIDSQSSLLFTPKNGMSYIELMQGLIINKTLPLIRINKLSNLNGFMRFMDLKKSWYV